MCKNNEEKNYTNCYVAFLDIQGMKNNILRNYTCNEIFGLFLDMQEYAKNQLRLNGECIEAFQRDRYYVMSDSIILYSNSSVSNSLYAIIFNCFVLQSRLLAQNILLRGGISKGDLFAEEAVCFGQGLVNAYLLESDQASNPIRPPQIIIDNQVFNELSANDSGVFGLIREQCVLTDCILNKKYINFLTPFLYKDLKYSTAFYHNVLSNCVKNLKDENLKAGVKYKYHWLLNTTLYYLKCNRQSFLSIEGMEEFYNKWKELL